MNFRQSTNSKTVSNCKDLDHGNPVTKENTSNTLSEACRPATASSKNFEHEIACCRQEEDQHGPQGCYGDQSSCPWCESHSAPSSTVNGGFVPRLLVCEMVAVVSMGSLLLSKPSIASKGPLDTLQDAMKMRGVLVLAFVLGLVAVVVSEEANDKRPQVLRSLSRRKRQLLTGGLSLFSVLSFPNDPCVVASDNSLRGTCLTDSECSSAGGVKDGNCASNFGACCFFAITGCGGTVSQNCTYIRNANFPSADATPSQTCTYTFNRAFSNLCQIRLDFRTLSTQTDTGTAGDCGSVGGDSVTVSSPFSANAAAFPPTVCGTLTGQHMYFQTGTTGNAGTLTIATGISTADRNYDIKVTYLQCDTNFLPPQGCTQYFTGLSGTISSYNLGQQLSSQSYSNCIRQEEGFCSFQVTESSIATPDPFDLSGPTGASEVTCNTLAYIGIPTSIAGATNMFCGDILAPADGSTAPGAVTSTRGEPFIVEYLTRTGAQTDFSGFRVDYTQVPC